MKRKLVISAGHSGQYEVGAKGFIDEKEETIALVRSLSEKMHSMYEGLDYDVMFSSSSALSQRIFIVNSFCRKDGLAFEFHFNKCNCASGTECVVSDNASKESLTVANELSTLISKVLSIHNRGVKRESQSARGKLGFVSKTSCPAVIIEICFIDNDVDVKKYKDNRENLISAFASYFIKKIGN